MSKRRTGGIMLRKHLLTDHPAARVTVPGEKDIAALATVGVTSEAADYPIDNVFDSHRGPGGSRWVAGAPGPQRLLLTFDTPQTLRPPRRPRPPLGRWRAAPRPAGAACSPAAAARSGQAPLRGGRLHRGFYTLNGMRDTSAARTSPTSLRTTA